ncbi:hypothetical protein DFH09DRAFT_1328840 [Mycena vulgaris]|nr:hypothetical protein DFH09DRAFT_1328840 [Mycena vulgaris]
MCPFLPPSSLDTAADVAVTSPAPASFRFLTPRGHGAQRWSASPSPQVTRTRRNLVPRAPDAAVPNQAPSTKPEFILGRPRPFSTRVPGAQIHIYCRVKPKSRGLFREIPLIYAPARLIGLDVSRGHACASLSPPFTPWDHQLWPGFATRGRPRALPLIAWYGGGSQLPRAGQLPAGQLSSSAYAGQADVRCVVPVTRGLRMHGYRARAQALCPVPALVEGETQWCAYAPDDPAPRRQARPREVACPQLVLAGGASSTLEYEARGGHWSGAQTVADKEALLARAIFFAGGSLLSLCWFFPPVFFLSGWEAQRPVPGGPASSIHSVVHTFLSAAHPFTRSPIPFFGSSDLALSRSPVPRSLIPSVRSVNALLSVSRPYVRLATPRSVIPRCRACLPALARGSFVHSLSVEATDRVFEGVFSFAASFSAFSGKAKLMDINDDRYQYDFRWSKPDVYLKTP